MNEKQTVFEDLKDCKGYILGVIAFATAVGTFMVEIMGFDKEPSISGVACVTVCMLFIGFLINRSEKRQRMALEAQKRESDQRAEKLDKSLKELKDLTIENRLDGLRTLLTMYMNTQPENHDTILKIAQKYFIEYHGDWVMTDEFLKWAENENAQGRKVHVPANLLSIIQTRVKEEKDGVL